MSSANFVLGVLRFVLKNQRQHPASLAKVLDSGEAVGRPLAGAVTWEQWTREVRNAGGILNSVGREAVDRFQEREFPDFMRSARYTASLPMQDRQFVTDWIRSGNSRIWTAAEKNRLTELILGAPRSTQDHWFWRGVQAESVRDIAVDRNRGFMSVSWDHSMARRFQWSRCCMMRILVPAGTPMFVVLSWVENNIENSSEAEVLLPPRYKLEQLAGGGRTDDGDDYSVVYRYLLDPRKRAWMQRAEELVLGRKQLSSVT